jgi:threonine dehydratase
MIPTLDHLREAYRVTSAVTQETPLLRSRPLAAPTGAASVFMKPESLQWTGSFKVRGAYWRLTRLTQDEKKRGVVAYSSGNFAQGLAAAGRELGVPVTIVMPHDAPAAKRDATAGYGARVVLSVHGERPRGPAAMDKAREISRDENLALLHPFDDPEIVAGQAGVGLEAIAQLERAGARPDIVLCPVGGGGLIAGVALAFHHLRPESQVIGVEAQGFDGMNLSLDAGAQQTARHTGATSICDGLMAPRPGDAPWASVRTTTLKGCTVTDAEVRSAMRTAFETLKLAFEPSGAASLAALLSGKVDVAGKTVLVIASGGNVSLEDFMRHVGDA